MSQTLRYLSKSALNSTLDKIPASSGAASSDNLQEVDSDDLPCSRRTMHTYFFWCEPRAPWHFLAKVLKYTYDGRDNRLAWLRELDKCPNHYEFQVATDVCLKNNQRSYCSYRHPLPLMLKVVWAQDTWEFGSLHLSRNHPLNCKSSHIFPRTITKGQSDQVFHSLWMSWIEWTVKWLPNSNDCSCLIVWIHHACI